ncbi:MAG TPA: 4'-phosphopantetheinyl transferase superfamily protein [Vicinamibacterales bacterium]|nr:4'-phosphopantetheinyl transferase superfamily protein [Vicinamibacterales bacterium]
MVHVWTVRQDAPEIQARLPSYETLLTSDEQQRALRFLHAADRDRFVIGRALARTMLSQFADVGKVDWSLAIDGRGRPHLASRPPGAPDLRFNLSHTPGLVACAVTVGREVGIDVEHVGRRLVHDTIPERFFSAREVADLRARPDAEQRVVFFDYWTLKESYIKARGLGLALPLGQFSFICAPGQAPSIEFAPELHDDPSSWQFAQFWPTAEHRMAVAVRRTGADLQIDVSDVVPAVPA